MKSYFLVIFMVAGCMTTTVMGQLAGYWKFDEGSGTTVADSSSNGKSGVLHKNGTGALPQWISGHDGTGGALLFNSSTDISANSDNVIVNITSADGLAALTKTGRAFSISMWVRTDAFTSWTGNWRYLLYTNAYDYELAVDPNDTAWGSTNIDDYFYSESSAAWGLNLGFCAPVQKQLGVWYHLALTFDGNYVKKYINGKLFLWYLPAPLESQPTATTNLFIGSYSDGSGWFTGALDEVAIWSSTYLPDAEIAKLANGTATPLTVIEHAPDTQLPVVPWEAEPGLAWQKGVKGSAWRVNGWAATWCCGFAQNMRLIGNTGKTAWCVYSQDWALSPLLEGTRSAVYIWQHMFPEKLDANTIYVKNWSGNHPDVNTHGVEWIARSWSGVEPNGVNNVAKIAAYITPGYAILDGGHGFTAYDTEPNRFMGPEDKPYFKTYARFSPVNAPPGCTFRVRLYTCPDVNTSHPQTDASCLTYFAELAIPIVVGDHQWQEFKGTLPKPGNKGGDYWNGYLGYYDTLPQWQHEPKPQVWFELSIQGGNPNTMLYIDEFAPISDQYIQDFAKTSIYRAGDANKNSLVYYDDIALEAQSWLDPYNFVDYANTTKNWLMPLFNNISGNRTDPIW
jgi:hypothetical protein